MRRLLIGPLVLLLVAALFLWWPNRDRDHSTAPASAPQVTLLPLDTDAVATSSEPSPDLTSPDLTSPEPDQASSTTAPPPDWADEDDLVLTGTDVLVEPTAAAVEPGATVEPSDARQAEELEQYEDAASEFMTDFARPAPGTDPVQWWSQVEPLMAQRAAEVYAGTDPQRVPFTQVTGPAQVVPTPAPAHLLRQVRVPTDAGSYLVGLETDETGIHVVDLVREEKG